jgi:Lysyl oxidase
MDVGKRIRIAMASGVGVAAAGAIALAGTVEAGTPYFVPDLRTISPGPGASALVVNEKSGRVVLRLSNKIANSGTGPLELSATEATGDCVGGEDPEEPDRDATQVLYDDTAPLNGVYDPEDDPGQESQVGCFEYHAAHGHWHFQDFAQFRLATLAGDPIDGIEPSRKIGFCILDGDRHYDDPPLPGSPPTGVYPENAGTGVGCGQGDPENGPGAMGLSVGYADIYTYSLPGQKLDVTGITRGTYCLVSIANPPEGPSDIIESNITNNERRKPIRINPAKDKAKFLEGTCPDPTP